MMSSSIGQQSDSETLASTTLGCTRPWETLHQHSNCREDDNLVSQSAARSGDRSRSMATDYLDLRDYSSNQACFRREVPAQLFALSSILDILRTSVNAT